MFRMFRLGLGGNGSVYGAQPKMTDHRRPGVLRGSCPSAHYVAVCQLPLDPRAWRNSNRAVILILDSIVSHVFHTMLCSRLASSVLPCLMKKHAWTSQWLVRHVPTGCDSNRRSPCRNAKVTIKLDFLGIFVTYLKCPFFVMKAMTGSLVNWTY